MYNSAGVVSGPLAFSPLFAAQESQHSEEFEDCAQEHPEEMLELIAQDTGVDCSSQLHKAQKRLQMHMEMQL